MAEEDADRSLEGVDPDRRAFRKRMAIGIAVTPIVTSFSMAALDAHAAYAQASNLSVGGYLIR